MPATRFRWTRRRLARLRQLLDQGHGYAEIAKRMGTTKDSASGAAKRYGLAKPAPYPRPRHYSREELDTLEELVSQGVPFAEIGRRLGRTFNSVRNAAYRIGITSRERFRERARVEHPGALPIIIDCIEVERMTVPMVVERLAAHGYQVSRTWVLKRIHEQGQGLTKELKANVSARRSRARILLARRQRAQRQQVAA